MPDIKDDEKANYLNRFSDKSWWVRKARKLCNQRLDEIDRELGTVSKRKEPYCGNISVKRRQDQKEQDRKFLAEKVLYNHKGQSFSLAELAATSVANPAVRRAEFMTRVKGFEIVADSCDHACEFYTLNQVHTRSLHAEENAFLQIAKYGGRGIEKGRLFTTASPCELCAKKAYQLGIKHIYYIDPYPGIAMKHILMGGTKNPELILYSGAIGRAFHRLYTPVIPYKDELNALASS